MFSMVLVRSRSVKEIFVFLYHQINHPLKSVHRAGIGPRYSGHQLRMLALRHSHFFIRIRIQGNDTDSTDPDPPHWLQQLLAIHMN